MDKKRLHKTEMELAHLFDSKELTREKIIDEFTNLMGEISREEEAKEYMLLGYFKHNEDRPNLEVIYYNKNKEEVLKAKNTIEKIQSLMYERKNIESFDRDLEIEQEVDNLQKDLEEINLDNLGYLELTRIVEATDL